MKRNLLAMTLALGLTAGAAQTAQAATFSTGFQATLASEQNDLSRRSNGRVAEGGPYIVSVNANNPGYAGFAADLPGTGDPAPAFQRPFTEDVLGFSFVGGVRDVLTVGRESGGFITYTTTDTTFDGFAQDQLELWTTNDPGSDLLNPAIGPNSRGPGYRSFGQIEATIDISGLGTGTVNVFYGAFGARPTVSAVMRDTDGGAQDLTILNAHLNNDSANRGEYYVAELDFEADGIYDEIVYTWLGNGVDDTGNGRFGGTVLTGSVFVPTVPEPATATLALVGLGGLVMRRRRHVVA